MAPRRGIWLTSSGLLGVVVPAVTDRLHPGALAVSANELLVALETGILLTSGLATFLMFGRYRAGGGTRDVVLTLAFVMLTLSSTVTWWIQLVSRDLGPGIGAGELATVRLLAALLFLLVVFVPEREPARRPRWSTAISATSVALVTLTVGYLGLVAVVGPGLPEAGTGSVTTLVLAAEGAGSVAFLVASVALALTATRARDPFLAFLAVAALALSLSRLSFLLNPSLYLDQVDVGDLFRGLAYLTLLMGALYEVQRSWKRYAADSLLAERRRMARQLHDGVAQETAYIATAARELLREHPSPELTDVAEAAERALDESRRVIHVYTQPPAEPLDRLLVAFAEEIAQRAGARIQADCEPDIHVSAEIAEAATRIVRESVTNAVRHGHADRIDLRLRGNGRVELTVADNGSGFDGPPAAGLHGFGVLSMRERAEALGGDFRITSRSGSGTIVEVVL